MISSVSNKVSFNQQLSALRHKATEREITPEDKIKAGVGAVLGTAIPIAIMMKTRKVKNPLKLNYALSDMITLSATSIGGSVAVGMSGENKATKQNKLKEGVFQFFNASIPTWIAGGCLKLAESSKNFNNSFGKVGAMLGGLIVGMYGAASLSNVISDPYDKQPDRKLTLLDCIANLDDAIGVLVLAKFPCADKLHLDSLLPFIYAYCGYRAGKSN